MKRDSCKLLILGGGPGGYVCADRAGQLGIDTILVEAQALGGTCLNVGCIPSKALIHAADEFHLVSKLAHGSAFGIRAGSPTIELAETVAWKDDIVRKLTGGVAGMMKKAKVRVVTGHGQIVDGKTVDVDTADGRLLLSTENLVIATGSRPQHIPALPFGSDILSSTDILNLTTVPERLVIVGGGYIGLEIGTAMAKLGAEVTVVEAAERVLPQYDSDLTKPVTARLRALGVRTLTGAKAIGFEDGVLQVQTGDGHQQIAANKVLVTVGRAPATDGFGLEDLGLSMRGRFLDIDDRCRTSMQDVFAIGDVTGDPMLAHRAMAQGRLVAAVVAGSNDRWDKRAIPAVCFTDPEIVSVGKLPSEAPDGQVAVFPLAGNGRAMTLERRDGFVRVVHDGHSNLVLGIQATGMGVSEMAGEFALAIEMAATVTDIAETIHAHPTLGESVQEVAIDAILASHG